MIAHLIIFTGPSGSGKTTIATELKEFGVVPLIGTTTRQPRPNEIAGVDYNFISESDFMLGLKNDEYLGYVHFGGYHYGTSKKQMLEGKGFASVILEPSGIPTFEEFCIDNSIFLTKVFVDCSDIERKNRMLKTREASDVEKRIKLDNIRERASKIKFHLGFSNEDGCSIKTLASEIIEFAKSRHYYRNLLCKREDIESILNMR